MSYNQSEDFDKKLMTVKKKHQHITILFDKMKIKGNLILVKYRNLHWFR